MNLTRPSAPRALAPRFLAAVTVAWLAAVLLAVATAAPAHASARLSVSSSLGGAVASSSGATSFTVSGSGFQAIEGGFGGVYLGFGWVDGSGWGPSNGGATGRTYDYVPDEQTRDNQGYQKFVAFPGSSTAGEAQETMGADGSFRVSLMVPGPSFTGAGGKRIDCLEVTCGFFTWGAHGVRNGANETFTPVTFQGASDAAAGADAQSGAPSAAGAPASDATAAHGRSGRASEGRVAPRTRVVTRPTSPGATAAAGRAAAGAAAGPGDADSAAESTEPGAEATVTTGGGDAVIEVDRKAARPGGAMGFAAAGFWPGEQVYVVLGDGDAAVGPVLAGVDGEVAGVLMMPEGLGPGTHEIRAAGAGSGLEAAERFALRTDIAPTASAAGLSGSLSWVFLALSTLALLGALAFATHRRRAEAVGAPADSEAPEDLVGPNGLSTTDVEKEALR